jgi:hypothetical protein
MAIQGCVEVTQLHRTTGEYRVNVGVTPVMAVASIRRQSGLRFPLPLRSGGVEDFPVTISGQELVMYLGATSVGDKICWTAYEV